MFFYSYLCEKYYKPIIVQYYSASQGALVVKNLPANAGDVRDMGLIPELESSPGGGYGNPLQYSCLENVAMKRKKEEWVFLFSFPENKEDK